MRISHKDHLHPSTKNWTAKCKRHIDQTGEPIVMNGYHTGSSTAKKAVYKKPAPVKNESPQISVPGPKFFDLETFLELGIALNDIADSLELLGLEAMYENGKWTLKAL